jgi:hypothetical protein
LDDLIIIQVDYQSLTIKIKKLKNTKKKNSISIKKPYNQLLLIGNLITYPTPLFDIDIDNLCDPNFLIKKLSQQLFKKKKKLANIRINGNLVYIYKQGLKSINKKNTRHVEANVNT